MKESVFQVLYTILLTHWNNCGDMELQLVMKAFQHSFQELTDLSVFKKNIYYLQDLNKRNRLFSKEFFIVQWRPEFLQSLLKVLFDGMHRILEDELIPVVYELAIVELNSFFSQVLPAVINTLPIVTSHKAQLLQEFSQDTDAPTFTRNVQQMLSSYRVISLSRS